MLTGIAVMVHGPKSMGGAWIFVLVVVVAIALIFARVYGRRGR
jgi:hypothetical protein